MIEDNKIVRHTSTAPLPEKEVPKDSYIMTWDETYPNGVMRCDFVHWDTGDSLICDFDPNNREIRVIADKRETLEVFFEVMGVQEIPDIHRAEIGIIKRKED